MINFTPVIKPLMHHRFVKAFRNAAAAEQIQTEQLGRLIENGRKTLYGERYSMNRVDSIDKFKEFVPVVEYPAIRPYVMQMINGEKDILWPGITERFAQSSGTSDGKSKYIPLTNDSLKQCHYRGSADVVAAYLSLYPDSRIFAGKSFILGGSFGNALDLKNGVKVGDLSAHLIENITPLANAVRIPDKETALLENWTEKLPKLVDKASRENVTNISGVPSWFLTVLKEIMRRNGVSEIHDLWPGLEVFFHGGISFEPYREQYNHLIDRTRMRYMETYNASEGFFALQDNPDIKGMLLLQDLSTFYEFIPLEHLGEPNPPTFTSWQVEKGEIYALAITSCNGLWRYIIGDTVKIETVNPLRISIAGRTRSYINAFGEELMVYNADNAIARATRLTGATITNYTAAPVFADDNRRGHHQWLIEFGKRPDDMEAFADALDRCLTEENSDYQAKRAGNLFLDRLEIVEAENGLFDRWLASTGKLGGQRKVPRLSNNRDIIDSILNINNLKYNHQK